MSKSWPIARMRDWMSNVLKVKPFPLTITVLEGYAVIMQQSFWY